MYTKQTVNAKIFEYANATVVEFYREDGSVCVSKRLDIDVSPVEFIEFWKQLTLVPVGNITYVK